MTMHTSKMSPRERIEFLEEENRQLREQLLAIVNPVVSPVPECFCLTEKESRLLAALIAAPAVLTKDAILSALYFDRYADEQPEQKIVDVFICKIRAKVSFFGVQISTVWGRGYFIEPQAKSLIAEILANPPTTKRERTHALGARAVPLALEHHAA